MSQAHLLESEQRIASIDGLRGVFCLFIVIAHCLTATNLDPQILKTLAFYGTSAVKLFFLVSGFLVYSSLNRIQNTYDSWKAAFWIQRFCRILPIWWILISLFTLTQQLNLPVYFSNLSFTFGFWSYDKTYLPNEQAWSLFVEECFYVFLPFFFLKLKNGQNLAIATAVGTLIAHLWLGWAADLGVPESNFFIFRHPLANFHFFLLGIGICHLYSKRAFKEFLETYSGAKSWYWLEMIAILFFFSKTLKHSIPRELSLSLIFLLTLTPKSLFSMALQNRLFHWVGLRCYYLYISQAFLMVWTLPMYKTFESLIPVDPELSRYLWIPIFLSISFLTAGLSWKFIELPIQKWGKEICKKYLKKRNLEYFNEAAS